MKELAKKTPQKQQQQQQQRINKNLLNTSSDDKHTHKAQSLLSSF